MARIVVFVTHVANVDAPLAKALRAEISHDFAGAIDTFVSSDLESIPAGERWFPHLMGQLAKAKLQVLLLGPDAIARPWVYFEAGAAWAKGIVQVPICHSGVDRGGLQRPLSELTAGNLDSPAFLRSLYEQLAKKANQNVPTGVDFAELSRKLIEVAASQQRVATPAGTGAPSADPVAERADDTARRAILRELHAMQREQARTPVILELDLAVTASRFGVSEETAQNALVDLLALGFVEPNAPTFGKPAESGAVKITGDGIRELERLERSLPVRLAELEREVATMRASEQRREQAAEIERRRSRGRVKATP